MCCEAQGRATAPDVVAGVLPCLQDSCDCQEGAAAVPRHRCINETPHLKATCSAFLAESPSQDGQAFLKAINAFTHSLGCQHICLASSHTAARRRPNTSLKGFARAKVVHTEICLSIKGQNETESVADGTQG